MVHLAYTVYYAVVCANWNSHGTLSQGSCTCQCILSLPPTQVNPPCYTARVRDPLQLHNHIEYVTHKLGLLCDVKNNNNKKKIMFKEPLHVEYINLTYCISCKLTYLTCGLLIYPSLSCIYVHIYIHTHTQIVVRMLTMKSRMFN